MKSLGSLLRSTLLVGMFVFTLGHSAMAQNTNFLRYLMKDHLDFEVHVTDERDQPLAGALLWINESANAGLTEGRPDIEASRRFAMRYRKLADFLARSELPGFAFERVNSQGLYRDKREYTSHHRSGGYPFILIATKRGYLPEVIEGIAPLNRHHTLELKLKSDFQSAPIDPRMERFDQIMALARNALPGEEFMGEPRMRRLQELERELRSLAQTFEQEGKDDDASALYWALAEFPEVKNTTTPDGSIRVVGYANSRSEEAAEADRNKAVKLNRSVPKLLIDQMLIAQGFPREGIRSPEHGRAYLDTFNQVRKGPLKEQLTPWNYRGVIYQAIKYRTAEEACTLLREAYQFEPFMMRTKDWWERIDDINRKRKQDNLAPISCIINGLPTR